MNLGSLICGKRFIYVQELQIYPFSKLFVTFELSSSSDIVQVGSFFMPKMAGFSMSYSVFHTGIPRHVRIDDDRMKLGREVWSFLIDFEPMSVCSTSFPSVSFAV